MSLTFNRFVSGSNLAIVMAIGQQWLKLCFLLWEKYLAPKRSTFVGVPSGRILSDPSQQIDDQFQHVHNPPTSILMVRS